MTLEPTPTPKEKRMISIKRDKRNVALITGAFAFGVMVGYILWGGNTVTPSIAKAPDNDPAVAAAANVAIGDEETQAYLTTYTRHMQGDPNAPVTIIGFGDFL